MRICTGCHGTGKMTITGAEITAGGMKTLPPVQIDCVWCNGTGQLTNRQAKEQEDYTGLWCRCEGHVETEYVPDGQGQINTHHWVCTTCGKIVQIG